MPWTNVNSGLNGEENVGTLYEKELQKINQKEFSVEKVIKTDIKLHVKWKGYDSSFKVTCRVQIQKKFFLSK